MPIEASVSKYKKNNFKIAVVVLLGMAIWFGYDGYFNEKFQKKNTENGVPNSTLAFNQKSPPYLLGGAVIAGVFLLLTRNKKVVADDTGLIANNQTIAYDKIEKIDKTHFESKGYFVITYKNQQGDDSQLKLSDKTYDNLGAILDEVVAKIS